jgi:hypothetical protein
MITPLIQIQSQGVPIYLLKDSCHMDSKAKAIEIIQQKQLHVLYIIKIWRTVGIVKIENEFGKHEYLIQSKMSMIKWV